MKKIFISLFLVFVFFINFMINISAKELTEIITTYCEIENSDNYLEESKKFVFDNSMLYNEKIYNCFAQINLFEEYRLEFIYNIYGESQYLLIESTSNYQKAYIIFDFLLEEAIEYSCSRLSDWTENHIGFENIKIYLNLFSKFYIENNNLYNINKEFICNIDLTDINFNDIQCGNDDDSSTVFDDAQLELYLNKVIRSEYDIENSFFFKNFWIDRRYEFNTDNSCAVVAASILLSYYDAFYNDNIISDVESYNNINYLTKNKVAKKIVSDSNDSSNFYIDLWNAKDFVQYEQCDFDSSLGLYYVAPAGPSRSFHNYLKEIAYDKGYLTTYMTISDTSQLINDFLEMKNISNISSNINLGRNGIIDILNDDIPVIIGMAGYDCYYYYQQEGYAAELTGVKYDITSQHAVVAYGYQQTSIGLFFHVNMGYGMNDGNYVITYSNDTYVNANLMGYYAYIDAENLEHVCSNYYLLYNEINGQFLELCPCNSFETNFNFLSSDADYDYVNYENHEDAIKVYHQFDVYELYNEDYHRSKCRLFEYCEKFELKPHNFKIINKNDNNSHYLKCSDCGYTKIENHVGNRYVYYSSEKHGKNCEICVESYDYELHNFIYNGSDDNHSGYCRDCNYEIDEQNHMIQINDYTEQQHQYLCDCGYQRYENHIYNDEMTCTICLHEHLNHVYSYTKYSSLKHIKYCLCGDEIYETHSFIIGISGNTCRFCGYFTKGQVTIDSIDNNIVYDNNYYYVQFLTDFKEEKKDEE